MLGVLFMVLVTVAYFVFVPGPEERSKRSSPLNLNNQGEPKMGPQDYQVRSTDQVLSDFEASFDLAVHQVNHFTPEYLRIWLSRLKEARRLETEIPEGWIEELEKRRSARGNIGGGVSLDEIPGVNHRR